MLDAPASSSSASNCSSTRSAGDGQGRDHDFRLRRARWRWLQPPTGPASPAGAKNPSFRRLVLADFMEWNVILDPHAIVRLLRSDLPIAIYPAAPKKRLLSPTVRTTVIGSCRNLQFIKEMSPPLRAYLAYAMSNANRSTSCERAKGSRPRPCSRRSPGKPHNVWENAVWLHITGRKMVRRRDGHFACSRRPGAADRHGPAERLAGLPLGPRQWHLHVELYEAHDLLDLRRGDRGRTSRPSARPCPALSIVHPILPAIETRNRDRRYRSCPYTVTDDGPRGRTGPRQRRRASGIGNRTGCRGTSPPVPQVWERLQAHFGVATRAEVLVQMGIDLPRGLLRHLPLAPGPAAGVG